jgi:hypothetical protein
MLLGALSIVSMGRMYGAARAAEAEVRVVADPAAVKG